MNSNVLVRKYTLKIGDEKWRKIKASAAVNGQKINDFIICALEEVLKSNKR